MKKTDITSNPLIKYGIILIFSILYLLVFSLWTTPLYKNWYGCDASFFTMAGRGITEGWVPYRDFFDLKGPSFFFIEALGQFICKGRTGAFIIQVIALFAAICLIMKTCRLFISRKQTLFVLTVFLTFHIATLWGGNTLEEYMLPLSLLCIYLSLKDLSGFLMVHPLTALITGICFSIIFFAKMTVAAPIIGLVISIVIFYIKKKQFRNLLEYLIYAFLGLLIPATLLFIYFALNDTLNEMLYSMFVFAFKRGTDSGRDYNLRWELKISGCYFALIYVICQLIGRFKTTDRCAHKNTDSPSDSNNLTERIRRDSDTKHCTDTFESFMLTLIACIAVLTAAVLHLGDPFIYYFTTVYPVLVLTFIAMFIQYDPLTLFKDWKLDIPLLAFTVTLCYFASHTASTLNTVIYDRGNTFHESYANGALEMASLIPASDRNSVYSINMDMQWFEITGILPCYSYTINLQYFVALDPRIQDRIIDRLETNPPKWIVVGGDLPSYLPVLNDVVMDKYTNVYDNDYGALYLLNS